MAHDFRNKTFQKVLRGYAPEEVDDYIAYLNEEYRKLERRTADSERKLTLALKKLDESTKNGAGDVSAVGPAAREAAAKLLRETEAKRSEMLVMAEQQANETAERIVRDAEVQAEAVVAEAVGQAEAILAEAKAQAEAHRNDVKTIYAAARGMYDEIGAFREKLFGLYNEHLDAIEGITDSAVQFMEGIDGQYPEGAEDADDILPEEVPEPDETDEPEEFAEEEEIPAEETMTEEGAEDELPAVEFSEEEPVEDEACPEFEEPEAEPEIGDDVASNLAFMDRLFASVKQAEASDSENHPVEDLYIDLPDDFEEEEFADFEEESAEAEADGEFYEEELPAIMIDWKNRSAAPVEEMPDESTDFRPAEGFEDFAEDYEDDYEAYEDGEYEENYDDYVPADDAEELTEEVPADEEPEDDEDEEEDEGLRAMDALFREDKSKRDMSLTDEFNIIFDDSKSSANVKEIRRQPMVSPEAPKNPKKHKNF